jgi:DNA-binding GntR family transcriptional regulator
MAEVTSLETSQAWNSGASSPSLAERAYHLILDRMLRGNLPIGSVLSRRKLAEEFRMSLVPVAQALQRLEIEGVLESRPRAGTRVKVPNTDELRERFELRQALECQSARLCAERATFQERLELGRMAENVDHLFAAARFQEPSGDRGFMVNKCHQDLHMRIAECARSELLKSQIDKSHVLLFNCLYDLTLGRQILPPEFHRNLIEVIVKGNPRQAEECMREHVIFGLKSIQSSIEPLHRENWRLRR